MPVHAYAREGLSKPIAFRLPRTRLEMLEAFRRADELPNLTPILREAVDIYIDERLRRSRSALPRRSGSE